MFSFNANAVFSSENSLMKSLNETGIDTVVELTFHQANQLTIHKLGPDGDHETIKGYNVRDIPAKYSEEELFTQRIQTLSFFRPNRRYPDTAIKIGNSLVCYASSPVVLKSVLGGNTNRRINMSRHHVNQFDFDWFSTEWRKCFLFPYDLNEIVDSMAD